VFVADPINEAHKDLSNNQNGEEDLCGSLVGLAEHDVDD
jgi:hypothetical protein